ncbi:DNA repair metallo-beta-lactamase-domain-containing protein [Gilbertella persicaria]|uniref:DNA repair metallo-beta-lactamase-domain-containing protein n=1 Tax=Gilbertella persicaria TaxID=101096 RepID=UPI00222007B4|nr:DNA repair metallo-beta-lactamase-domain-containing protein [Gilbertella persicaria]KAI8047583.1 DNA repair metallo-beta-lactamase-domain-containing protein [Gilbertella persicaria]
MVVDAFSFGDIPGCEGYFLSHFHADHYTGLDRNWTHGPIYCSEVTARLVKRKLGVTEDFIYALPLDEPCLLPGMDQLFVTLIDANHCPGAVIFLVTVGKLRYLHTGDFRACPKICLHPLLKEPIDIVYLDTTYLDPKYSFPSQDSCIQSACQLAKRHSTRYSDPLLEEGKSIISASNACQQEHRLLIVVGTYSLGKERIFIEIAKALNSKIFVTEQKRHMLDCFHDSELNAMLTDEQKEAQVHVIPIGHLVPNNLEAYLSSLEPHFSQMIALKPTGWTFQASSDPKTKSQQEKRSLETIIKARPPDLVATSLKPFYDTSRLKMYDIPYSEHSSFRELAMFIASLDIRRIVPTVNVHSQENRSRMSKLFEEWNRDKKKLIKANGGSIKIVDYPSINYW